MDWRARAAERVETPQPEKFNAPLFRSVVEKLETRERWVVLDLGAALTQTIALFSQYRCRLDIADIAGDLNRLNAHPEADLLPDIVETLLPKCNGEATDLVLCWDLLNYLDRPALTALMARIAARNRPGALVHALIFYSKPQMPILPGRFVPLEDNSLLDSAAHREEIPAQRYSPDDLSRCLPAYSIEKAMLLSNGMQEFLFRV